MVATLSSQRQRGWRLLLKQAIDRTLALLAMAALLPLLCIIAVTVLVSMGPPVLFRQRRPGKDCVPFTLLKFRTMESSLDRFGKPLSDDRRLTPLGRLLRATSLDELPQLWNVLRGDLSLVGPRPLLMQYLERYTPEQMRRHEVMPGITGWAQINGRNALSWPQKFDLDVWYADHWSLGLDLHIMVKTLRQVIRRQGISQAGHVTMPEFNLDEKRCEVKHI